ncbi:TRAP transporter substrate-binding protein DctP [Flagellimonas iocasae]|uniref:TRAP transporter substrate-binding protein DctP n=1 Tax=Flagellimonas iocasae TaxID=2055905 RepID=A0ABW4XWW7_9FLAO
MTTHVAHKKILIVLFLVAFGFTSCKNNDKEGKTSKPGLIFRLALEMKPETKIWEVANLFREELQKASPEHGIEQGEIVVDFYDQGSIGTERQLLEACSFGVVEVVQVNSAVVTTIEPSYAILNLPYLFVDKEHHQKVLNGPTGKEMLNMLSKHDLQGLGFYSAGFRSMFFTYPKDRPCASTPEEFKGLKIRVMESPTMINTINAMGASASPLPFSELYQGIKTGVVDGAENSVKVFASYRYQEAGCNCFSLTEHSADQHVLIVNQKWLNDLEPKYRNRIKEVASAITPKYNAIWDATSKEAMEYVEQNSVRVQEVDKTAFMESVTPVYDEFFEIYPNVSRALFNQIKND